MKIKFPTGERALVRREPTMTVSNGGIVLPDESQRKNCYASIVALPADYSGALMEGDRVLLEEFSGTEVADARGVLYIVRLDSILAVANEQEVLDGYVR